MVRWGIIGCGKIAHYFVKDLLSLDGHQLQGVASRSQEKADAFAKEYNASASFGSYSELLADESIDVVYIATPHNSHMEWALHAMNSKKHVLCEKPLAANKEQVQKMINASLANKVFLMEALWSRFNPTIKEVKKRCDRGELGTLSYLNAEFCFYSEEDLSSRLFDPALAGGALLDVGIYPIFLAYLILGYPLRIHATALLSTAGVDMQTTMLFEYADSSATLICGLNCDLENNAVIAGTKGRFVIPNRWHEAQLYKESIDDTETSFALPTQGRGYTYEILEVEKCISQGWIESPDWTHQNSLDLCSILDEVRDQIGLKYPFE